jgi:hypothetical protein
LHPTQISIDGMEENLNKKTKTKTKQNKKAKIVFVA